MNLYLVRPLFCFLVLFTPFFVHAQPIVLQGVTDFGVIDSGEVPYYRDLAGGRDALAINAGIESYREKFARADHVFAGPAGLYDVVLDALGEIDGEGEYHLLIDGVIVGQKVNPAVVTDFQVVSHTFADVNLAVGTVISVESNAVSNDTIPEGNAFAFARGRWQSLQLNPVTTDIPGTDSTIDLVASITSSETAPVVDDMIDISVDVNNASATMTATAPVATVTVPDAFGFVSSAECSVESGQIVCALPEIAPQGTQSVTFTVQVLTDGLAELQVSVEADQSDIDITNNVASLTLEIEETVEIPTVDEPTVDEPTGNEPTVDEPAVNEPEGEGSSTDAPMQTPVSTSTDGGAMSMVWLLILLAGFTPRIVRRRIKH